MKRSVSLGWVLYALIVGVAAWLRMAHLGQTPLSDREASAALLAADSAFAPEQLAARSASYGSLTAAVFGITGAQETAARWIPALAGVLLVLVPLLMRRQIGSGGALLTAALLAVSPSLWAAARTAGGLSLSILGLMAAVAFLIRARTAPEHNLEWAAAAVGLVLVSGRSGLVGLTGLAAGWLFFRLLGNRRANPGAMAPPIATGLGGSSAVRLSAAGGVAALALGTGFGLFPRGVQAVFDGLGEWAAGWVQASGQPAGSVLLQLPAYELLVLVFGGIGVVRALRMDRELDAWLASWAVGAGLVLLVYRGRQPQDLVWMLIPLALLAAPEIGRLLARSVRIEPVWVGLGAGGGVLALLGFSYLQLRGYVSTAAAAQSLLGVPTLLGLALMGLLLAFTALSMVGVGWSFDLAWRVAGAVGLACLVALGVSAGVRLNSPEPPPSEAWRPQTSTAGLTALRNSLQTLSEAQAGGPEAIPIQLLDFPTPALAWAMRGYDPYQSLDPADSPPIILVRQGAQLPGEYLGQSITIGEQRVWPGAYPPQLLSWWLTRSGPTAEQRWVLLARPDVAGVEQLSDQLEERPLSEPLDEQPLSEPLDEQPPADAQEP